MRPALHTILKLAPVLLPFLLLFAGGLALAVAQSLGWWLPFPHQGAAGDAYRQLLSPHMAASFLLSLRVGFVSAAASVALGTLLAVGLWRMPSRMQQMGVVYKIPLILPHIAVAFIVLVFFARSGVLSAAAYHAGLISGQEEFPSILFGGSGSGMIMAYVYKQTPFVILMAYASLKRLDPRLLETARMLGAGMGMQWRRVLLPHLAPVLHTSFIILFLHAFGAFEIPFMLGESRPAMPGIEAYSLYFQRDLSHRPAAMAILVCMFLFSLAFIVLYTRAARRFSVRERPVSPAAAKGGPPAAHKTAPHISLTERKL